MFLESKNDLFQNLRTTQR